MERNAVARLLGAPPGYVGYEEAGQLTEAIRRRPYAPVLLCSMRWRSPPRGSTCCCRLLDDGASPIPRGRTVDFRNTVVVMTATWPAAPSRARPSGTSRTAKQPDAA